MKYSLLVLGSFFVQLSFALNFQGTVNGAVQELIQKDHQGFMACADSTLLLGGNTDFYVTLQKVPGSGAPGNYDAFVFTKDGAIKVPLTQEEIENGVIDFSVKVPSGRKILRISWDTGANDSIENLFIGDYTSKVDPKNVRPNIREVNTAPALSFEGNNAFLSTLKGHFQETLSKLSLNFDFSETRKAFNDAEFKEAVQDHDKRKALNNKIAKEYSRAVPGAIVQNSKVLGELGQRIGACVEKTENIELQKLANGALEDIVSIIKKNRVAKEEAMKAVAQEIETFHLDGKAPEQYNHFSTVFEDVGDYVSMKIVEVRDEADPDAEVVNPAGNAQRKDKSNHE